MIHYTGGTSLCKCGFGGKHRRMPWRDARKRRERGVSGKWEGKWGEGGGGGRKGVSESRGSTWKKREERETATATSIDKEWTPRALAQITGNHSPEQGKEWGKYRPKTQESRPRAAERRREGGLVNAQLSAED